MREGNALPAPGDRSTRLTSSSSARERLWTCDWPGYPSRANWGIVLGSFKWVYAILSPVGGYVADRVSRRHVICASLFVWSAVTWATAHVDSFAALVAARAVMGVSEAFYIPAAPAMITDFHAGPTRSPAVGLHQVGIYVGIVIGGFADWGFGVLRDNHVPLSVTFGGFAAVAVLSIAIVLEIRPRDFAAPPHDGVAGSDA